MVGALNTYNTGSRFDGKNYAGNIGVFDALPERRGSAPVAANGAVPAYRDVYRIYYGAVGLNGVWASENSREAIFTALQSKDTFATSAPLRRLQLMKGCMENGELREWVFDEACSDRLAPQSKTHRCAPNGAKVDLKPVRLTLKKVRVN